MKLGTWQFRIGINRRGNYKPRWFWLLLFFILLAELLYNLIALLIASPLNALMVILIAPMAYFIWTRLWYLIEVRTGNVRDRNQFNLDLDDEEETDDEEIPSNPESNRQP